MQWRSKLDLSVYLVTNEAVAKKRGRTTEEVVLAAVAGGATVVQIREKGMTTRQLADLTMRVKPIANAAGVPIVVNDSVHVAMEVGADGAHVGQNDMPAWQARAILGPDRILGVSVYSIEEALAAEPFADYLGIGPVGFTRTKIDALPPMGLDQMALIAQAVTIPVVAIGGIVHENAAQLVHAGLDGVAVISAIVDQPDVAAATRSLSNIVRQAARTRSIVLTSE